MESDVTARLKAAAALIRDGERAAGKALLLGILEEDPANDRAWVWLSATVDEDALRRECLDEALKHNPHNTTAQTLLAKLDARPAPPPAFAPSPPADPLAALVGVPAAPPPVAADRSGPVLSGAELQHLLRQLAFYRSRDRMAVALAQLGAFDYQSAHRFLDHLDRKYRRRIRTLRLAGFLGLTGGVLTLLLLFWGVLALTEFTLVGTTVGTVAGYGLLILGTLGMLVGGIWMIAAAFSADLLWGLAVLLLPPAWFFFLWRRADKAAKPFLVSVLSQAVAVTGVWLAGLDVVAYLAG